MGAPADSPLLTTQAQLWKARAMTKQKWLEQSLEQPPNTPQEAAERTLWITRALKMVKRGQASIRYRTALMDAYAQHLSAIEMTLMSAAERQSAANRTAGNS